MLKLFTTPTCGQCPIVKSTLEINEIPYEEIDASANPHVAAEYGVQGAPTIVVNDEEKHVGTGACLSYLNS